MIRKICGIAALIPGAVTLIACFGCLIFYIVTGTDPIPSPYGDRWLALVILTIISCLISVGLAGNLLL